MLRSFPRKKTAGFTLIEMIVVVGITMFMSAIMVAYNSSSRSQINISVERVKISQVIARAKAMTLNSYAPGSGACGYGVHFFTVAPQRYELVRYDSTVSPPNCADFTTLKDPSTVPGGIIESYPLAGGLQFGGGSSNPIAQLVFFPPDPRTKMVDSGGGTIDPKGYIYLRSLDGSSSGTVSLTTAGQITY